MADKLTQHNSVFSEAELHDLAKKSASLLPSDQLLLVVELTNWHDNESTVTLLKSIADEMAQMECLVSGLIRSDKGALDQLFAMRQKFANLTRKSSH